jgi:hypothetical protein
VPEDAKARAIALLAQARRPLIGVHASGGRESKQWHLDRFADVARELARLRGGTIVLTGAKTDRPLVDAVAAQLGGISTIDVCGTLDLVDLAAVLSRLDVLSQAIPARCTSRPRSRRRSSRSSDRPIRDATVHRLRCNESCVSICRAARAGLSGFHPSVAVGTCPTAWTAFAWTWWWPQLSKCWTRRGTLRQTAND